MDYRQKRTKYANERPQTQKAISRFSESMQKAMGLTQQDIEEAAKNKITWEIQGFTIYAEIYAWNHWEAILVALPTGTSIDCGYTNIDGAPPKSWHFLEKGTATEILPPQIIQHEIIVRISNE